MEESKLKELADQYFKQYRTEKVIFISRNGAIFQNEEKAKKASVRINLGAPLKFVNELTQQTEEVKTPPVTEEEKPEEKKEETPKEATEEEKPEEKKEETPKAKAAPSKNKGTTTTKKK